MLLRTPVAFSHGPKGTWAEPLAAFSSMPRTLTLSGSTNIAAQANLITVRQVVGGTKLGDGKG